MWASARRCSSPVFGAASAGEAGEDGVVMRERVGTDILGDLGEGLNGAAVGTNLANSVITVTR